jgi:hypothetical protein
MDAEPAEPRDVELAPGVLFLLAQSVRRHGALEVAPEALEQLHVAADLEDQPVRGQGPVDVGNGHGDPPCARLQTGHHAIVIPAAPERRARLRSRC